MIFFLRVWLLFSFLISDVASLSLNHEHHCQLKRTQQRLRQQHDNSIAIRATPTYALFDVLGEKEGQISSTTTRRSFLAFPLKLSYTVTTPSLVAVATTLATATVMMTPTSASAKCTNIDSCRDIGDKKIEKEMKENPIITFEDTGVRYKQLKRGFGENTVKNDSFVDMIYSISSGGGVYMYSQGFGYEKVDASIGSEFAGIGDEEGRGIVSGFFVSLIQPKQKDDSALSSYRVRLGKGNLPIGVEQALLGMKKGERRRIEVPPSVGFETSNWKPEPTTRIGKQHVQAYQRLLAGNGPNQPPYPAPTIWDVEILSFRE